MKLKKSIKYRFRLLIVASILLTTFLTYQLLIVFYSKSNENFLKNYYSDILAKYEKDFANTKGAITLFDPDLNMKIYGFDDVEAIEERIPNSVDQNKIISVSQKKELESGKTVINKIKTTDGKLELQVFIHPIIENNKIVKVLFLHIHINSSGKRVQEEYYSFMTIFLALLSASITVFISRNLFKKPFDQLEGIRLATIEVSKGNLDAQILNYSSDELGELSEEFNTMSTKLKNEQIRVKEFMEDFSHEIKTPLALVKNYNQALMDNIVHSQEEKQKCYHVINRETNRLQKLIQNFLDFTKLDANSVELKRQPIVFAQSVEDIMMKYELTFKEKNIKLDMKLDYDIIISADEDRLEQIIQNIIQNAIRYSKGNPRIEMTMERTDKTCVLAIADNGIGISKEDLSTITNRFVRVNKVRSRKESGTGLGLSIVEKLMDLHGGKMTIESQLGAGTTVKLEFPVLEADD